MFRRRSFPICLIVCLGLAASVANAALGPANIVATDQSDKHSDTRTAERTIDTSGLWAGPAGVTYHNRTGDNMWLTTENPPCPASPSGRTVAADGAKAWVSYEFDDVYTLGQMWVWNNNDSNDGSDVYTVRGLKDVIVDYSTDGSNWFTLGTTHVFAQAPAPASDDYPGFAGPDFAGASAKYVVIAATSNYGEEPYDPGADKRRYSLSEVEFRLVCDTNVSPADVQESTAVQNEAADPPSFTYTFLNTGGEEITSYTVQETDASGLTPVNHVWLSLTDNGGGGPIPVGGNVTVDANIIDTSMPYEIYTAYVTFTDDCSPADRHVREIQLTIGGPPPTDIVGPFIPEANFANVSVSSIHDDRDGYRTIDGSGLNENLEHGAYGPDMWLTAENPPSSASPSGRVGVAWIEYEFDQIYQLGRTRIWNNNDPPDGQDDYTVRGLKDVTVEYSTDGSGWTTLGTYVFEKGIGSAGYEGFTGPDFANTAARHVVITASSNWGEEPYDPGGNRRRYSLSEIGFEPIGCLSTVAPVAPQTSTAVKKLAAVPSSFTYTFENSGTVDFAGYTVQETNADGSVPVDYLWLSLDDSEGNGGPILSGDHVSVIADITDTNMPAGTYTAYVTFTDDCTPPNQNTRRIDLTIQMAGYVPEANFTSVTVSSIHDDRDGYRTIDESGLDPTKTMHDQHGENMWLTIENPPSSASSSGLVGAAWIAYEFDRVLRLDQMWVWNNNDPDGGGEVYTVRGLKDVTVEYSTDGSSWATLGTFEFPQSLPASNDYLGFAGPDFAGALAKYVVITASSNWGEEPYDPGGNRRRYSLSEVRLATSACPLPFADADEDGDVDQQDFGTFQLCFTGDGGTYEDPSCYCFDRNGDNDIDLYDHSDFEDCATGPDVPFDPENPPPDCLP